MVMAATIGFIIALSLAVTTGHASFNVSAGQVVEDRPKYDCHPDQKETDDKQIEENCKTRGCLWLDHGHGADSLVPRCFFPADYFNYQEVSVTDTPTGVVVILTKDPVHFSGFDGDVTRVRVEIKNIDNDRLRIKITDMEKSRWEPPLPKLEHTFKSAADENKRYDVNVTNESVLTVTRKSSGSLIIRTDLKKLIFAEQFIQLITDVPSNSLYGLGDNLDNHQRKVEASGPNGGRKRIKIFNYGDLPLRGRASYGSHPFYLMHEENQKDTHGVLLINSNPMDVVMTYTPSLTYRVIGGILDFYIFLGPTPVQVMRQKAKLIGNSPLPPYWALG